MSTYLDLYAILKVDSTATTSELKKAYRVQQRATHPDTGGSNESFRAVENAWHILGNVGRRREYDVNIKAGGYSHIKNDNTPNGYREQWGNTSYIRQEYAKHEKAENARWHDMYAEQNQWFDRAKQRREDYATSTYDYEFEPSPHPVREGLTEKWLKWFYLALIVLNIAAVMSISSIPNMLLAVLPGLVIVDIAIVISVLTWSVMLSIRFYSERIVIRSLALTGAYIVTALALTVILFTGLWISTDIFIR